jgi:hypothetical protein
MKAAEPNLGKEHIKASGSNPVLYMYKLCLKCMKEKPGSQESSGLFLVIQQLFAMLSEHEIIQVIRSTPGHFVICENE